MSTNKKYNLENLTESHIDELIKEPNIKEMLINIGVVPKNDTGWFGSNVDEKLMFYFDKGIFKYGIDWDGDWVVNDYYEIQEHIYFPANPLQHLIKEAVKRGFVEGCSFKSIIGVEWIVNGNICFEFEEEENILFLTGENALSSKNNNHTDFRIAIMQNGIWATVIKPENEITVNNPQTVEYCQNGVFVPASVIKSTPNNENLGEVVRRKFNEKSE